MKKLLSFILILCFVVGFTSCQSDPKQTLVFSSPSGSPFDQFEKELNSTKIVFEKEAQIATLIGAKEGYSYTFDDGSSVELYLFDKESKNFYNAVQTGKIELQDTYIEIVCHKKITIGIVYLGGTTKWKPIIERIFNNIQ
jgi:hypothetical protein